MTIRIPLILALLAASPMALADEDAMFKLSGYGTLAATHSSNDQADFRTNFFQPNGAGYTRETDIGTDSKVAVQLDAFFTPKLTATVQLLAQRDYDKTYTPQVEWANLKFKPVDNFYLRAGRIAAPAFMISEYRNVGYAQTTVRTPNDMYFLVPIFNVDGLDMGYDMAIGDANLSFQLAGGRYQHDLETRAGTATTKINAIFLNSTLSMGDANFRIGYVNFPKASMESDTIDRYYAALDALEAAGVTQATTIKANMNFKDTKGTLFGLGASYDPGNWLVQSEISWRSVDTASILDTQSWYVLGGVRLGKWTPYASISQMSTHEDYNLPLIPGTSAAAAAINAFNANQQIEMNQDSLSFGVRYDVWKNMDLKLQFDHIKKKAGSIGSFAQNQPGFVTSDQYANIVTLAFDYVF